MNHVHKMLSLALSIFFAGCVGAPPESTAEGDENAAENVAESGSALNQIPTCNPKGMTWTWHSRNLDVDSVGYDSSTDPYHGDRSCGATSLPILCILKPDPALPMPGYVNNMNIYNQWAGGTIRVTSARLGSTMTSRAAADSICEQELGCGWRMAEFHDGWGWDFQAYGSAPANQRFWVAINDQRANCWDLPPECANPL